MTADEWNAARTLDLVDAVLRIADPPWKDPEILAWEAGQIDPETTTREVTVPGVGLLVHYRAWPGPRRPRTGGEGGPGVHVAPMLRVIDDHEGCACEIHEALLIEDRSVMRVTADAYPHPDDTTHGPLLLGPEPSTGEALATDPVALQEQRLESWLRPYPEETR